MGFAIISFMTLLLKSMLESALGGAGGRSFIISLMTNSALDTFINWNSVGPRCSTKVMPTSDALAMSIPGEMCPP